MDILIEVFFRAICYPIGWPIVKIFTLGKFPGKNQWMSYSPESEWTAGVGFAAVIITIMTLVLRNT